MRGIGGWRWGAIHLEIATGSFLAGVSPGKRAKATFLGEQRFAQKAMVHPGCESGQLSTPKNGRVQRQRGTGSHRYDNTSTTTTMERNTRMTAASRFAYLSHSKLLQARSLLRGRLHPSEANLTPRRGHIVISTDQQRRGSDEPVAELAPLTGDSKAAS